MSRISVDSIPRITEYAIRTGRSRLRIPLEAINVSLLQNVQTGCWTHLACYSTGTWFCARGKAWFKHPPPSYECMELNICSPPIYLHGLDMEDFTFIFYCNNVQVPCLLTRFPTCFAPVCIRKAPCVDKRRPLFSSTILAKSSVQIPFSKASFFF
jgi:hypothetical protein